MRTRTRTKRGGSTRRPTGAPEPRPSADVVEATKEIGRLGADSACARAVVDGLVAHGHAPTLVTINVLIKSHVLAGRAHAAEALLDEMREAWQLDPDSFSYNLVLRGWCAQPRRQADAERVLSRACAAGLDDACSYSTVLAAVSAPERATRLLGQMEARGVPCDAIALHAALRAYARAGMGAECEALLPRLPAGAASPFTFAHVAKAWANAGVPERAEAALRSALGLGLGDATLFAIVADAYAEARLARVTDAARLVEEAVRVCAPGSLCLSLFHALLKAHARERPPSAHAVEAVCVRLRGLGLQRSAATVCASAELLCAAGLPREALAHVSEARLEGIAPSRQVWNVLISGYARCRCLLTLGSCACELCCCSSPDQGLRLLRQMQAQGLQPDGVTLSTLLASFCRAGRVPDALGLLESMLLIAPSPRGGCGGGGSWEDGGGCEPAVRSAHFEVVLRALLRSFVRACSRQRAQAGADGPAGAQGGPAAGERAEGARGSGNDRCALGGCASVTPSSAQALEEVAALMQRAAVRPSAEACALLACGCLAQPHPTAAAVSLALRWLEAAPSAREPLACAMLGALLHTAAALSEPCAGERAADGSLSSALLRIGARAVASGAAGAEPELAGGLVLLAGRCARAGHARGAALLRACVALAGARGAPLAVGAVRAAALSLRSLGDSMDTREGEEATLLARELLLTVCLAARAASAPCDQLRAAAPASAPPPALAAVRGEACGAPAADGDPSPARAPVDAALPCCAGGCGWLRTVQLVGAIRPPLVLAARLGAQPAAEEAEAPAPAAAEAGAEPAAQGAAVERGEPGGAPACAEPWLLESSEACCALLAQLHGPGHAQSARSPELQTLLLRLCAPSERAQAPGRAPQWGERAGGAHPSGGRGGCEGGDACGAAALERVLALLPVPQLAQPQQPRGGDGGASGRAGEATCGACGGARAPPGPSAAAVLAALRPLRAHVRAALAQGGAHMRSHATAAQAAAAAGEGEGRVDAALHADAPAAAAQLLPTELRVGGLACEGCCAHLRAALEQLPGVSAVQVSAIGSLVRLVREPRVADRQLEEVVERAGCRLVAAPAAAPCAA